MPTHAGGGTDSAGTMPAVLRGRARCPDGRPAGGGAFLLPFNPQQLVRSGATSIFASLRARTPPNVVWGVRPSTAGWMPGGIPPRMARPVGSDTATPHDAVLRGGRVCWSGVGSSCGQAARLPRRRRVELADVRRVLPRRAVPMMSRGTQRRDSTRWDTPCRACRRRSPRLNRSAGGPTVRGRRRRGGRPGGRAGRRRRCPGHCFQCPGGDHRGTDRRGGGLRTVRRRAPASAWPAGRRPSDRPGGRPRAGPTSTTWRAACRAGTMPDRPRPSRDGGPPGAGGGRARTGRRGCDGLDRSQNFSIGTVSHLRYGRYTGDIMAIHRGEDMRRPGMPGKGVAR